MKEAVGWHPVAAAVLVLLVLLPASSAWDKDAGVVPPLAFSTRTVAVTSNDGAKAGVIDGNDQVRSSPPCM